MNILLISSSPHRGKSQTLLLANQVLTGCGEPVQAEVIHLSDLKIEFCVHCEKCHKKILDCPVDDDVHMVLDKMLKADGIIIASPNYINQVTGSMKTLLDRSSHFIHCKRLLGKYVVGVVSSGSGNDTDILAYIKYYAHVCGAQFSGGISDRAPVSKEKLEQASRLGSKFAGDIKAKTIFPDQVSIIEEGKKHFRRIMEIRKEEWTEEYQYWRDNGWL